MMLYGSCKRCFSTTPTHLFLFHKVNRISRRKPRREGRGECGGGEKQARVTHSAGGLVGYCDDVKKHFGFIFA
jgi:hypothetical protein